MIPSHFKERTCNNKRLCHILGSGECRLVTSQKRGQKECRSPRVSSEPDMAAARMSSLQLCYLHKMGFHEPFMKHRGGTLPQGSLTVNGCWEDGESFSSVV